MSTQPSTLRPMANDLQGVVRGLKEGYQSVPRFNYPDLDLIVWTFQLERHDESEERLDPIPVEPFYP